MLTRIDPDKLAPDPDFVSRRGPAVDPARFTAQALRERFAREGGQTQSQPEWVEQGGDGALLHPERRLRPAAVLIGLVERPHGTQLLLTRRSEHLPDHAGQISFPGGRIEASDEGPVAAALREAHEEIGLDPRRVEVLGTLPVYRTISGYEVTPVVAAIDPAAVLHADPLEVEEFFEVPLSFLMDGANHQRRLVQRGAERRTVYVMEYRGPRRYLIWGATAAMLRNLYRFVLAEPCGAEGAAPTPDGSLQSRP